MERFSGECTHKSSLPGRLIFDPLGRAGPLYFHGPVMLGALWMEILLLVEKR